jgi:CubicO group peptidase (beta-lactamase class C family)
MIRKLLLFLTLSMMVSAYGSCSGIAPAPQAPITSERIAAVIDRFRQEIPRHMRESGIPGMAVAVVDEQGILWQEGFGYTDWDRRTPVTPSTIFSLQSMSKSFTATAAMIAAQDGLVDLDAPITTYLPDFKVHSIFEEHPEQKMTLRILLSHTAGFPHDTSYGGNHDNAPYSFEKHIASISDTWLMFPVGTRYHYSNEGIDLAGYILEVRSGMPFIQYVREKVLDPLGMKSTTLDYKQVRAASNRAIGHYGVPLRPPVDFQIIPSGGVWSSAEDMARYVQFHINKGVLDGDRLLREDLAQTMYTPPNPPALHAYQGSGYALGVTVGKRNNAVYIEHGGGGFGFNNDMAWYPELKLGIVVLSNARQTDSYSFNLCLDVLDSIIASDIPLYRERFVSAAHPTPAYLPDTKGDVLYDNDFRDLIASKALAEGSTAVQNRRAFAGTYITTVWGFPDETIEIHEADGKLTWTYHGGLPQFRENETLTEVEPGLFFSENGNSFDLRGPAPMIDNIRLKKANTRALPFTIAVYAVCGLIFLSAAFYWPARAIILRKKTPGNEVDSAPRLWIEVIAALASFFSLFCLALIVLVPNLVHVRWPIPYLDLAWWQFALVGLPFASLLLGIGVTLASALAVKDHAGKHSAKGYILAVGLALIAFNAMVIF